jgi:Protein of unknown function (DUF3500)
MLRRTLLFTITLGLLATVAIIARQAPPANAEMTDAATKFLTVLTPEQKEAAKFSYDDPHRLKWFFTPQQDKKQSTRKGIRLDKLDEAQKTAAYTLLKTGLSASGYQQATTIVSLESLLASLEPNGANTRNPSWYFVSIFGEPSATGAWGWRFEGHHLSVNFTLDKGTIVASTPILFASNPANVMNGDKKGLRPLPETEDLAKELIATLSDEQKTLAQQTKQFPEIKEGQPDAAVGQQVGIPMAKLTPEQTAILQKLIQAYTTRLTPEAAKQELDRAKSAGADKIHFAYCVEPDKKGKPYSYRVHGPTFVVEFLNIQADAANNPANHIHSAWRRLPMDFALPAK